MARKGNPAQPTPKPSAPLAEVIPAPIVGEMEQSYLDYAMSIIVARALPDVRDGLKPVHRRILFAMWQLGLRSGARFRKSATVVGEVLGKYHPHGDMAVYDTMVRLAQDFSVRYPLILGQGNFGSMDGDGAAAMRYCVTGETRVVTERGLEKIGSLSKSENFKRRILSMNRKVHAASRWFDSGEHPTLRFTTTKGYELQGSYNHPVLTWQAPHPAQRPAFVWKRLDRLRAGDIVVLDRSTALWPQQELSTNPFFPTELKPRVQKKRLPSTFNASLAFILGSLAAEGSFIEGHPGKDPKIEFCNTDQMWVAAFKQHWASVFPDCRIHEFHRQPSSYGKQPYTRLEIHSQHVFAFLKNLGVPFVNSTIRTFPETLFLSPKTVVAAFLSAYFEGDGCISSSRRMIELSCCSASKQLIKDLQILLLRFGIDSFRRYDRYRTIHKLYIRGNENYQRFEKEIGFLSHRKQQRLREIIASIKRPSSHFDFIPGLSEYVRSFSSERPVHRLNFDRYFNLQQRHQTITRLLPSPAQTLVRPLMKQLLATHYLFEHIVDIRPAGVQQVYSIKVESDCHSFIGNGFINHNTEAKLARISDEMLLDIEKETVNFQPNYDGTQHEPTVLPSKIPQLLLNGTVGIAVGMATNIPPHNLGEVADGLVHLIDHPDANIDDLMKFIQGPDFPTGGIIFNTADIKEAFATGKGGIVLRGRADIEEKKTGEFDIIISEVPYQLNKATFLEKIAELVKDKRLEGIKDLRDESNKDGVRVVVELKKEAYPKKVLNRLYSLTPLQSTFHVNMLALVEHGTQPRVLTLKMVLEEFIKHRQDVIRRRTAFDLARAEDRAHILEGLKKAQDNISAVIKTIRASKDREIAKTNLMKQFKLTDRQATAILEMRLSQLANLERQKIEEELKEKRSLIKELKSILASPKKILDLIKEEVLEAKRVYASPRRTEIVAGAAGTFSQEDLIPKEAAIIMVTRDGYIKRVSPDTFKQQSRGGKGVIGLTTKEEDTVNIFLTTHTHANLQFFTSRGKVFQLKAYEVPAASRTAKGQAVVNFLQLAPEETISSMLSTDDLSSYKTLVMVTTQGLIKKVDLESFKKVRQSGIIAIKLKDDDQLRWVKASTGQDEISLVTRQGQSIRFKEKDVRSMGRTAAGVRGIRLHEKDEIIGMDLIPKGKIAKSEYLLTVMARGFGKRTTMNQYKVQGRGGSGIKTAKITSKTGEIRRAFIVSDENEANDLIIISAHGQVIRMPLKSVPKLGRATQGVRLMRFKEPDDEVASVTRVEEKTE